MTRMNFSLGPDVDNHTHSHGPSMSGLDIAYVTVTVIISLLSILGCLVVLAIHWLFADLRTVGRGMLVHLTVADMLTALGNLMGVTWYLNVETMSYRMGYCKFHSALTIMSSIASFMWTVVIAWFVFWIILQRQPSSEQRHRGCCSKVLPVVCWGIPVLIAVLALWRNVLGYDVNLSQASWCWIDPLVDYPLLWMLVTGKAWEVAACVGTVSLYMAVKIMLFRQAKAHKSTLSHHNRQIEEANTKLTFVPLVFIAIRIWGTIRFLLGIFARDYASSSGADWIVIMQGAGDSAQGFANCVIYCFFTKKIRQRLLQSCRTSIQRQSSHEGSESARRVSEKMANASGLHSSNRVHSNRVAPILPGTPSHQQDSNKLKPPQEHFVKQPRIEQVEKCVQHEEQQLNVPILLRPTSQTGQSERPQEIIVRNICLNENTELNKTHIVIQNEIDTVNRIANALDGSGDDACKEVNSLEGKHLFLWTTDVIQARVGLLGEDGFRQGNMKGMLRIYPGIT